MIKMRSMMLQNGKISILTMQAIMSAIMDGTAGADRSLADRTSDEG